MLESNPLSLKLQKDAGKLNLIIDTLVDIIRTCYLEDFTQRCKMYKNEKLLLKELRIYENSVHILIKKNFLSIISNEFIRIKLIIVVLFSAILLSQND